MFNVYDKRDKFKLSVVRLTPGNKSDTIGYSTSKFTNRSVCYVFNNLGGLRVTSFIVILSFC